MNINRVGAKPALVGPFVKGLISAVAFGAVASSTGSTDGGVVTVAVGMGIVAAVFAVGGTFLDRSSALLYDGLAVLLFVPTVAGFVRGICGEGIAAPLRWAALALLLAVAGVTAVASFLTLHRPFRWGTALALLGAVETLFAITTFVTGTGTSSELAALALMVPGAFVLGLFAVRMPDAVLGVAAVALGMHAIYAASTQGACGVGNSSGLVVILLYCGAYAATRAVSGSFGGRRRQ